MNFAYGSYKHAATENSTDSTNNNTRLWIILEDVRDNYMEYSQQDTLKCLIIIK